MTNPRDLFPDKMIFKVKGQKELPKWQREAIRRGLESESGPPESLRFQCRIATDANENFEGFKAMDGGTFTVHQNARSQFGKDHNDLPYLTVTVTHTGTGESYKVRWEGDAVPVAMQKTAVAHDEGRSVAAKQIALDFNKAKITTAHRANSHPRERDNAKEWERREELRAAGIEPKRRRSRHCGRLTSSDV